MASGDSPLKCLFFDVFGTCVDWRKTVTDALYNEARSALDDPRSGIASYVGLTAWPMTHDDWGTVAQEWRTSYLQFTRSLAHDPTLPYKTVDQHHLEALRDILHARGLTIPSAPGSLVPARGSLWDDVTIQRLSKIWHFLDPWPDTNRGLALMNAAGFQTCTLSNGNLDLLHDMVRSAGMPFTHVYSAEMFQSYKPSPKVYLGAVEKMGLQPEQCAMVAAHLDDLKAARANGLRTVYVERKREERHPELKDQEGIVDVWVTLDEDGFVTAVDKLASIKGSN